ncbi:MAG: nuclear transport factor 2 family protein [Candidatus Limnocylindrales bacterium]
MDIATVNQTAPDAQGQVRRRLEEIWPTAAARDFDRLESFHLYGPKFTEFKDGRPRGDAASCAAGERATFSRLEQPTVDMRDLAINVFADVAVATFNGHFTGQIAGNAVALDQQCTMVFALVGDDWKIIHEHMSPLGGPGPGAGGPPPGAGGPLRT